MQRTSSHLDIAEENRDLLKTSLRSEGSAGTMPSIADDVWSKWWLAERFGGDENARRSERELLKPIRNQVLDGARLRPGDCVLDVGTGDGFIGFGVLERLGSACDMVLSDVSPGLLRECERIARERGLLERCRFVLADATELAPIADETIDVITARSVLCYLDGKAEAIAAFARVLRPGGRISLFEIIHTRTKWLDENVIFGYSAEQVSDLRDRLLRHLSVDSGPSRPTKLGFTETDLMTWVDQVGFVDVTVNLRLHFSTDPQSPRSWDTFLSMRPHPLARTIGEGIAQSMSDQEALCFERRLRPLVEAGRSARRLEAWAYLTASKPAASQPTLPSSTPQVPALMSMQQTKGCSTSPPRQFFLRRHGFGPRI
jgi:ubiquinone/menaquinone biosynthesis C-methylase UbiE